MDRHLHWDGCANVRDLGGLRTRDGHRIRRGALVRADALDRLSARGWAALEAFGVRTVIDLRNDDELGADAAPRPAGLTTLHLPLDGVEDTGFWKDWHGRPEFGTPLYYRPFLDHFPERTAAVMTAIARAEPGGVAVHCGIGRDRTGLIAILLLAVAGVEPGEIAADYALSEARVTSGHVGTFYEERGITAAEVIAQLLAELDVEAYLRGAGVGERDLRAIRERLLSAAGRPSRPAGAIPRPAR
jgi:protein-tyrosine phosphatase